MMRLWGLGEKKIICLLDPGDFLSDTFYNLDLIITELTGADCKCTALTLEMKHQLGRFELQTCG